MANIAGFNAGQYGEMQNFEAVPAQKVPMMITESEMRPTKDSTGSRLVLVASILDGQSKGRKIYIGLNLANKNKQAEDIAGRELAAICKAIGIMTPTDSVELHNKPFMGDIGVKPKKDEAKKIVAGQFENFMKGYEPMGAGGIAGTVGATAAAGSAAPVQPAAQAPASPPWAAKK